MSALLSPASPTLFLEPLLPPLQWRLSVCDQVFLCDTLVHSVTLAKNVTLVPPVVSCHFCSHSALQLVLH